MVVEDDDCLKSLAGLCNVLGQDAIVLCGAGTRILESEAKMRGWGSSSTSVKGAPCLTFGGRRLFLVAEEDAPKQHPQTLLIRPRADGVTDWAYEQKHVAWELQRLDRALERAVLEREDRGEPAAPKIGEVPATVVLPEEAAAAGVIMVLDGHMLREFASLSKVIWTVSGGQRSDPLPVFHLATSVRQVLLEDEEQLQAVAAGLAPDGHVKSPIDLPGQPVLPKGAAIVPDRAHQGMALDLPAAAELPAMVRFRLRMPSLGFVVRLRDRFACPISEVFFGAVRPLLEMGFGSEPQRWQPRQAGGG